MLTRLAFLAHNLIAHPIAGVLWFLGFDRAGDRVHTWWAPPGQLVAGEEISSTPRDATTEVVNSLLPSPAEYEQILRILGTLSPEQQAEYVRSGRLPARASA